MARTGRFGTLPSKAPDLTATMVALFEAAEAQRDRNILSAWAQGGTFEGRKVTDGRIKAHFRGRMNEYDKGDPERDYWKQQYDQIDYDIGESKALLRYEQEKLGEAGMSRWYTQNAKRFPRNSEAWREAMRNAAQFKKAAQEKARATNTVSDYEKYNNRINAINRNYLEPAAKAAGIVDSALSRMNVTNEGFLGLDDEQKARTDTHLQQFLRNDPAAKDLRKQWEKITGSKFSYRSLRKAFRRGEQGAQLAVKESKRYGYSPLQYQELADHYDLRNASLGVFRSNMLDEYQTAEAKYNEEIAAATDDAEAQKAINKFQKKLKGIEKQAHKLGDDATQGAARGRRLDLDPDGNVTAGRYIGERANAGVGAQADVALDPQGVEAHRLDNGDFDDSKYTNSNEQAKGYAKYLAENKDGRDAGTHVYITIDGDRKVTVPLEDLRIDPNTGLPSVETYATKTTVDSVGDVVNVYSAWAPVTAEVYGGSTGPAVLPGHAARIDGVTIYRTQDENGEFETSDTPWWDDAGEVTDPAFGTLHERSAQEWVDQSTAIPEVGRSLHVVVRADATHPLAVPREDEEAAAFNKRAVQSVLAEADKGADLGELGETLDVQEGVPGGFGSDVLGPLAPTTEDIPGGTPIIPDITDDMVLAFRMERGGGEYEILLQKESMAIRGDDPDEIASWEQGEMDDARAVMESNIANGNTPDGTAPLPTEPGQVITNLDPRQLLKRPAIRSNAITSRDKTGNIVFNAHNQNSRGIAAEKVPAQVMAETVLAQNNVDPTDPATAEQAVELSRGVDAIYKAGQQGLAEDQWTYQNPVSGAFSIIRDFGSQRVSGDAPSQVARISQEVAATLLDEDELDRATIEQRYPEIAAELPKQTVPIDPDTGGPVMIDTTVLEGDELAAAHTENDRRLASLDPDYEGPLPGAAYDPLSSATATPAEPDREDEQPPVIDPNAAARAFGNTRSTAVSAVLDAIVENPWMAAVNADRAKRGLPSLLATDFDAQGNVIHKISPMPDPAAVAGLRTSFGRQDPARFDVERFVPLDEKPAPTIVPPALEQTEMGKLISGQLVKPYSPLKLPPIAPPTIAPSIVPKDFAPAPAYTPPPTPSPTPYVPTPTNYQADPDAYDPDR